MPEENSQAWQRKPEQTNLFWLTAMQWTLLIFGRRLVRVLLLPVVTTVYFFADAGARQASRSFLGRVAGEPCSRLDIWRHMYVFATVIVDRILFLSDRTDGFCIDIVNESEFQTSAGAVLVVSHFGNFDALRVVGSQVREVDVHILLDKQHNANMYAFLAKLNPQLAARVLDAGKAGPSLAIDMQRLLAKGAWVGIMGDRVEGGQRSMRAPFLGGHASFPLGPWLLAVILKQPVVLCFGVFEGGNKYRLEFQQLELNNLTGRTAERAEQALLAYTKVLEAQVRRSPTNWFNFYDFFAE